VHRTGAAGNHGKIGMEGQPSGIARRKIRRRRFLLRRAPGGKRSQGEAGQHSASHQFRGRSESGHFSRLEQRTVLRTAPIQGYNDCQPLRKRGVWPQLVPLASLRWRAIVGIIGGGAAGPCRSAVLHVRRATDGTSRAGVLALLIPIPDRFESNPTVADDVWIVATRPSRIQSDQGSGITRPEPGEKDWTWPCGPYRARRQAVSTLTPLDTERPASPSRCRRPTTFPSGAPAKRPKPSGPGPPSLPLR
jgi:hypothetical protein